MGYRFKEDYGGYNSPTRWISSQLREEVMARDLFTCILCLLSPMSYGYRNGYLNLYETKDQKRPFEIDHAIPFSKHGKTIKKNLQLTCIRCNHKKRNKTLFGVTLGGEPHFEEAFD